MALLGLTLTPTTQKSTVTDKERKMWSDAGLRFLQKKAAALRSQIDDMDWQGIDLDKIKPYKEDLTRTRTNIARLEALLDDKPYDKNP